MCIACSVASAATVYKWVDEEGVTHYSDQPHDHAEIVELGKLQTYAAPKLAAQGPAPEQDARPNRVYASCAVAQPSSDQVFFNTFQVNVALNTQPDLRPGDRVLLVLDGKSVAGGVGKQFTLSPVDRGSHSLLAAIQDANGQTVCQAAAVTFHVRQPSQKAPNAANRPRS